jgi:serine phosphatase RsbU (regulator of sigma subunit)
VVKALQFTSYIAVPLISKNQILGALTLVSAGSGRRFGEDDLLSAQQLAGQVASVVERARRHERDHQVSHMLQQSLLPDSLPEVKGLDLIAKYLPAGQFTEVGGDWYDAFAVGSRVALVIGDVEGHDMLAATIMGNHRIAMRAFMNEEPSPARAIARLNRFAVESEITRLSTVLVSVVDPRDGSIVLATAGHPPPITANGTTASLIDLVPGPPIGIAGGYYPERQASIAGETIVLFTDGLIEDRSHPIDVGISDLLEVVLAHGSLPLDELTGAILEVPAGSADLRDDVALLVARSTVREGSDQF